MKIDVGLRSHDLQALGGEAAAYERLGADGLWSSETVHDPFLPLLVAALATERVALGTGIAVAFARTPFSLAQTAWDLQRVSRGRLLLGLGTQVRAHIERRFAAAFEHPAARIVDYIGCLRAIWDTFQNGTQPAYEGRFYRFTLISDFFNPGPIEHPDIKVSLAGVGEPMARAAGLVADGFQVHPLHSPGYLRDVVRPAIAAGARSAGRDPAAVDLITSVFIVTGATEKERAAAESHARQQIAFYASTPTYRPFLAYHGFEALGSGAEQARPRAPLCRAAGARPRRAARGRRRQRRARPSGPGDPRPLRGRPGPARLPLRANPGGRPGRPLRSAGRRDQINLTDRSGRPGRPLRSTGRRDQIGKSRIRRNRPALAAGASHRSER